MQRRKIAQSLGADQRIHQRTTSRAIWSAWARQIHVSRVDDNLVPIIGEIQEHPRWLEWLEAGPSTAVVLMVDLILSRQGSESTKGESRG
eukprot:3024694-Rhodomonas_salina.1